MWAWIFAIGILVLCIVICFFSKRVRENFSDTFDTLFYNTKSAKRRREAKAEQRTREYEERIARQKAERKAELINQQEERKKELARQIEIEREELRKSPEIPAPIRTDNPVKKQPLPNLFTNEQIMTALKKLDEITEKTAYKLSVNYERTPDLFCSKLGGVPYWHNDMEYPKTVDGTPLVLLAQINLNELATSDVLPQGGLLQFFVEANPIKPAHRVVYHCEIDDSITPQDVLSLGIPTTLTCTAQGFPLNKELALDTEKTTVSMGGSDYKLSERFNEAAEKIGLSLPEDAPEDATLYSEAYRCLPDAFDERHELNKGSWLLGYPYFAQEDVRYYKENEHYDTLLFQLDSVLNSQTREYDVLWGDCGVGNFFINGEDLKKHDFSNTLFSTDCY